MTYMLKDNSIVFASNLDKLEILHHSSDPSLFLNLTFFDYRNIQMLFRNNYLFYLKENYGYSIDFSRKIKRYFDYIDIAKTYSTEKLESLKTLKKELLDQHIIYPMNLSKVCNKTVYSVNKMPVPRFFQPDEIIDLEIFSKVDTPITLSTAMNQVESCLNVYEKIVDLLEAKIAISNIKIVNATKDDEYYLQKLCLDSNIPLVFHHPLKIQNHPKGIALLRIMKRSGYQEGVSYLNKLLQDHSFDSLTKVLVRIFNSYKQSDIENHMDMFLALIEEASIPMTPYTECVESISFDDIQYDRQHHYLLMNYNDQTMPRTSIRTEYLNKDELNAIGYISNEEEHQYFRQSCESVLNGMEHLYLFFSAYSDQEQRISDLQLSRELLTSEYNYQVHDSSYLKTFNQLEFAKASYNVHNFYLERPDYPLLYNTYHSSVFAYHHEFSGIHEDTLKDLLNKHNTITGAKVESYYLCQFQYLLRYLLKLDDFETSMAQYLGTLSHKVLEEFVGNQDLDYQGIVKNSTTFPIEEEYKETIYKTAITKEMDHLIAMVKEFHQQSEFKDITPETKFQIPFRLNPNYSLTGTIDKVMCYTNEQGITYYALIDYKLSSKDFKIEEFLNGRSMQLPVYLYAYKATQTNKVIPVGFYYQTTTLGRFKRADTINDHYQLAGISKEDSDLLQKFDPECKHIKAVGFKKDSSLKKSTNRLKTQTDFDDILIETEDKIDRMIQGIESGEFAINPVLVKGIGKDSVSCEYCTFYSICYNKNKRLGGEEE